MLVQQYHGRVMCDMCQSQIWVHFDESLVAGDVRVFPFGREEIFPATSISLLISVMDNWATRTEPVSNQAP